MREPRARKTLHTARLDEADVDVGAGSRAWFRSARHAGRIRSAVARRKGCMTTPVGNKSFVIQCVDHRSAKPRAGRGCRVPTGERPQPKYIGPDRRTHMRRSPPTTRPYWPHRPQLNQPLASLQPAFHRQRCELVLAAFASGRPTDSCPRSSRPPLDTTSIIPRCVVCGNLKMRSLRCSNCPSRTPGSTRCTDI